jgi:hypothetical protein
MDQKDIARFDANVTWFNQFYDRLKYIFDEIAEMLLADEIIPEGPTTSASYYYYASKTRPSIPPYYALGLKGFDCALQIFAVLDVSLFRDPGPFKAEPSLVVVTYSQADRFAWYKDFGLRVVRTDRVRLDSGEGPVVSGSIINQESTRFHAFQVAFDDFADARALADVIDREIIRVLQELPDWCPDSRGP